MKTSMGRYTHHTRPGALGNKIPQAVTIDGTIKGKLKGFNDAMREKDAGRGDWNVYGEE
jgi:hypothetical protein